MLVCVFRDCKMMMKQTHPEVYDPSSKRGVNSLEQLGFFLSNILSCETSCHVKQKDVRRHVCVSRLSILQRLRMRGVKTRNEVECNEIDRQKGSFRQEKSFFLSFVFFVFEMSNRITYTEQEM